MEWDEVERRFDEPTAHDVFINVCAQAGRLDHAAECYRLYLEQHPGHEVALRRQKQIATRAMFELGWRRLTPSGANWRVKTRYTRFREMKFALHCVLLGYLMGNLLGVLIAPADQAPSCDGILRGSPMCLVVEVASAVQLGLPYAVCGALVGLAGALLYLRRHSS